GGSLVQVYNADGSLRFELAPFGAYAGGARVATGDVSGDGFADVVVGAGPGGPGGHGKGFDGATGSEGRSFLAFDGFGGGVFVAAGDVNGDGFADLLVVAGQGGNGHVKVFDGHSGALLASFLSFPGATGEVQGTLADLNGDHRAEVVVGSGGQVRVFS